MTTKTHYDQSVRNDLIAEYHAGGRVKSARKTARILAVRVSTDFEVETDRGLMQATAGDYLVTNHPDDDPGSDVWSISADRFHDTYEPAE